MIGGQYLDITGTAPRRGDAAQAEDRLPLRGRRSGSRSGSPGARGRAGPWRAFGDELGLLFQIVDDILDGDGYVVTHGVDGARRFADEAAERARARLGAIAADTACCARSSTALAVRTA